MSAPVTLPFWLAALLVASAVWLVVEHLIAPSVRWVLRRRIHQVVHDVNRRLQIHVQPFKLTKRQVLIDRVIYDPEVQRRAEDYGQAYDLPRDQVMAKVRRYAEEIVPAFNAYLYFRLGYWLSRRLARALFRVRIGYADEEKLAAVRPESTIVFVMNHRSNFDYILVSYLVAERTALSYAVGEWARIFPLEALVRSMGAYFVRRKSRNDLYRAVLARYVAMATAEGVTQAVYPEGGLSRDGLIREPKLGLIDYMVRSYDSEESRDVVFVPVALNYDRVLEDRTLLLERAGRRPQVGRLRAVIRTLRFVLANFGLWLRGRWYRFGYACVNFGSPLSLDAHLASKDLDLRRLDREERFAEVAELAAELMRRVGEVMPALPVALVATVLVEAPDRRWTKLELKAAVLELMRALSESGVYVYVPRSSDDYSIEVGLRMLELRRVITEREGILEVSRDEEPLLRYYANSIAHLLDRGSRAVTAPPKRA